MYSLGLTSDGQRSKMFLQVRFLPHNAADIPFGICHHLPPGLLVRNGLLDAFFARFDQSVYQPRCILGVYIKVNTVLGLRLLRHAL